jgi:hypothetical protein
MIKNVLKGLTLAGLGLAFVANTAHAQKPGVELGLNLGGFSMISPDGGDKITVMSLGSANFGGVSFSAAPGATAAWYLNEMIAIEPSIGFGRMSVDDGSDATTIMTIGVGVPIYLKKGWGRDGGLFVTPFIGTGRISSGGETISQTHLGANVGTKLKISDNVFWRIHAGVDMGQENDDFVATTAIGGGVGINVYLR